LTLGGADAENYSLTQPGDTSDITAKGLTATGTAENKVYDAKVDATVTITLSGVIDGDLVEVEDGRAEFEDKNVGDDKLVTFWVALKGDDAGNYTVPPTGTTKADITPLELTATGTADDKVYDGTVAATVTITLTGVIDGDLVEGSATGEFADKNVGEKKTVTIDAVTLSGQDAGNYTVLGPAATTADITARPITVKADNKTKVFGENDPPLTYQVTEGNLVEGDQFTGHLTREDGEAVDTYLILQGSLTAGSNYDLTFVEGTFTITADATPGSISGIVWRDNDAGGTRDDGEPVLAGQVVFLDLDGNGVLDADEPIATTDGNGWYVFPDLAAGTYLVRLVLQNGWFQTYPGESVPTGAGFSGSSELSLAQRMDVNGDGAVSARDVLLIVNALNSADTGAGGPLAASGAFDPLDVNRDGVVSAQDALLVINWLNRPGGGLLGGASGESFGAHERACLPGSSCHRVGCWPAPE
jgi:hypothetical protein